MEKVELEMEGPLASDLDVDLRACRNRKPLGETATPDLNFLSEGVRAGPEERGKGKERGH